MKLASTVSFRILHKVRWLSPKNRELQWRLQVGILSSSCLGVPYRILIDINHRKELLLGFRVPYLNTFFWTCSLKEPL